MTGFGSDARGFTLLETVAALAIFVLTVTVLSTAYVAGTTARGAIRADRERAAAVGFVRDNVVAQASRAAVVEGGAAALPGGPGLRWRAEISPLDYTGLYAVDISIEYEDGRPGAMTPERVELYRPAWITPAESQAWKQVAAKRWKQPDQ
jgi:prepilin-type N-terminal cleavage/methylation domain-containing protein